MKTLVTHPLTQIKLNIDFSGKLTIGLPGGKQYEGKLTAEESEQLAFRVHAITNGEVSFDPPAVDFISMHTTDMITLEQQAEALEALRVNLQTLHEEKIRIAKDGEILESRLSDCERDLYDARVALRESRVLVSELHEQIQLASGKTNAPSPSKEPEPGFAGFNAELTISADTVDHDNATIHTPEVMRSERIEHEAHQMPLL